MVWILLVGSSSCCMSGNATYETRIERDQVRSGHGVCFEENYSSTLIPDCGQYHENPEADRVICLQTENRKGCKDFIHSLKECSTFMNYSSFIWF